MENKQARKISLLKSLSIFAKSDDQFLSKMAAVLEEIQLDDGEQLFQIGDVGEDLYIIQQGKIKIHDKDYVFIVLESGQIFGEYALIDEKERSASATSIGKTSLYQLKKKDFTDFSKRYAGINEGLLTLLIGRLRDENVLEERLVQKNVEISIQKDEIEKQRDEIKAQKDMKDKLFSIISHDLKGPVGWLDELLNVIKWQVQNERFDDLMEMIEGVSEDFSHLSGLLENLLNYAAQELSQIPYNPEKVNLSEMIEFLTQTLQLSASSKQIEIKSEVDPFLGIWVDRNSAEIILRNLIGNALKFTPENGTITFSASESNDQVHVNVSDTGIGMSANKMENLFSLDAKSTYGTKGEKGVGLGLQLVSQFTKLNKGDLSVVSEEGVGTTFTISLPAG